MIVGSSAVFMRDADVVSAATAATGTGGVPKTSNAQVAALSQQAVETPRADAGSIAERTAWDRAYEIRAAAAMLFVLGAALTATRLWRFMFRDGRSWPADAAGCVVGTVAIVQSLQLAFG